MPLNADHILTRRFDPIETRLTDRDAMFYALSIGIGRDPLDPWDLAYVYEDALRTFPTMAIVVGHPGNWMGDPATGITRTMVVHGAQRLEVLRPLPVAGVVVSTNRVREIWDKGDKGAIMEIERETHDPATGDLLARSVSSVFCRADGGFGGAPGPAYEFAAVPDRPPDRSDDVPTHAGMALLYRLNNDRNPLHADPAFARRAGFERPILHGLATLGIAAAAIARARPDRTIRAFETRFSRPVFPGETISIDQWDEGEAVAFGARIGDRVVLDRGRAELA